MPLFSQSYYVKLMVYGSVIDQPDQNLDVQQPFLKPVEQDLFVVTQYEIKHKRQDIIEGGAQSKIGQNLTQSF